MFIICSKGPDSSAGHCWQCMLLGGIAGGAVDGGDIIAGLGDGKELPDVIRSIICLYQVQLRRHAAALRGGETRPAGNRGRFS